MLSTLENEQERRKIEDIYKKYRYKCLHIAKKYINNHQMAEDVVEDAFMEMIKHKNKILSMDCSDLLPYIVTIVKSRAINIVKKENRTSDMPIEEFEEVFKSSEIPIDEQIINKQGFERLVAHISKLNENYKVVFEMKYIHNMSNGEIAEKLNITKKNVETRLHRAKIKLRELIESEAENNV